MRHPRAPSAAVATLALLAAAPAAAQERPPHAPAAVTREDYARAERFLGSHPDDLVYRASVDPTWLDDGRFWYPNRIPGGVELVLVDPAAGTRARAFDHARIAAALSEAADTTFEALGLPLRGAELSGDARTLTFEVGQRRFSCRIAVHRCMAETGEPGGAPRTEVVSPDGRRAAFIRDHDLWVRELETGREIRLTTDGVEDFGYATNNAGWVRSDRPVLQWSPDSRKIATFRHDARGVGMMYLTTTEVGHPELDAWRYPLPEDTVVFRIHRVVIDVDAPGGPEVIPLRMPPDVHRSSVCDHVSCGGTFADLEWSDDAAGLAFLSTSRDHKHVVLRVADARTGEVRDVLEERVPTFFESGHRTWNWRVLEETDEVIWFSRKDGWSHLYLHELRGTRRSRVGALKRRITSGDWNVLQVLRVDPGARTIIFIGNEREPGNPYYRYLYRVGIDDGRVELLTPERADHEVTLSPSGERFVDTYSTHDRAPVTVLRDADGDVVLPLEEADVSELVAAGWKPPTPITVKARDGETDLHGFLFRPTEFDPSVRYPVINYVYPGPQSGSVRTFGFAAARRDLQALAELGFVVVSLNAMGTPMRSRAFHEAYYGNMGDNGLPDQIGAIRQLAERHPWIDVDRVGIYGHSGGGFAAARGILAYPDFYRVAVSQAGNHDNRNYEDDWGEKWQGLLVEHPDGTTSYDNQANQLLAENLEGKLLLAHGTLDDNVPPSNTMLLVDALIAANEDFDLILFPNRRHGFGNEPYMTRRRWDYFVRHLLGAEPPEGYELGKDGGGL